MTIEKLELSPNLHRHAKGLFETLSKLKNGLDASKELKRLRNGLYYTIAWWEVV